MKPEYNLTPQDNPILQKIYRVIYLSDTKAGKIFDISLLIVILISTILLMLETVPVLNFRNHQLFITLEIIITALFTLEYFFRIITVKDREEYIFSFFGIIDFLSIVPTYISLFFPVAHYFIIIRLLRMLRVFRIFNLADYMHDGNFFIGALRKSSRKIYIFLLAMSVYIIIIGAIMYVVEGGKNGFESIPQSIYWATVTVTTVGYGDVSPVTPLGKFIAILVMLSGFSIIATGIVTSELRNGAEAKSRRRRNACQSCNTENENDASFCKKCGEKL